MPANRTALSGATAVAVKAPGLSTQAPAKEFTYPPRRDGWELINGKIGGWYYRRQWLGCRHGRRD